MAGSGSASVQTLWFTSRGDAHRRCAFQKINNDGGLDESHVVVSTLVVAQWTARALHFPRGRLFIVTLGWDLGKVALTITRVTPNIDNLDRDDLKIYCCR